MNSIGEKLKKIAENEPKVYEAGREAGKKAEYDEFWDSINTQNVALAFGFAGNSWNDTTFKPKKDIILVRNSMGLFNQNICTNIKQRLQEQNVRLDVSKVTQFTQAFYYAATIELPEIDLSNSDNNVQLFTNSKIKSIDKITFKSGVTFVNVFQGCSDLENIRIGGPIDGSGFDIHWSTKLTADSLKSIINALSTTTTGLTITLPTTAQSNYEAVYGSGSWSTLTATRSNWTIAYAKA